VRESTVQRIGCIGLVAVCLAAGTTLAADDAPSPIEPYRIGVEDRLRIVVYNEPELSGTFTVRPDGRITVPLVNDVLVLGETTDRVKERITAALSTILREPNVTVIADTINSYRIYFLGEVRTPGAMQMFRRTRLLQAIATAGGPTEFAKNQITLIREDGEGETRQVIDYKKLLAGDPGQPNVLLQPGDTLVFH
jgi:polysaccharide export outer membrane protein